MKRTTIALPDELSELLEHEAKRRGLSVSELVRRAIRNTLLGRPSTLRPIPWAGIFEDSDMVPGRQVDDELERSWADDADRRS